MTYIGKKNNIVPVHAVFSALRDLDDCPADSDLKLEVFMTSVVGYGNVAVVLDETGTHTGQPETCNRVFYRSTEAEVVSTAVAMLTTTLGPVCGDGNPAYTETRLTGWNLTQEIWPILCTKWIRYRDLCRSLPYRAMLQDPAARWFSHPCLLNADAAYRQGRPTKHGFCEVDPSAAFAYLLNDDTVPAIEDYVLRDWLKSDPAAAMQTVDKWLNAMQDLTWLVYGDPNDNGA